MNAFHTTPVDAKYITRLDGGMYRKPNTFTSGQNTQPATKALGAFANVLAITASGYSRPSRIPIYVNRV